MSQPANDDFSQHLSDDEASYHEDASENEGGNGNSKKRISTGKDGVVRVLPPVSAVEIHVVEKERKARTILFMAIPKEHLRRFHGMDDAKEIWEAIRTSSEGLEKGYDRFQQLLSQLEAHGAEVSTEDANHKFLRSLPPAWSNLAMTMRTKPDVDTLSIDDLYNNLRVFEQELTSTSKSSANAQNIAFVSHSKSSNNKVKSGHTGSYSTYTPSTSSNNIPEREVPAGFADEVIYSLFAKQSEDLDLLHEDLEQIDDVDIEEMDINWQIAMIAIRMKKFYKKTGRRVRIDGNKPVGFDKKKLECFKCHNTGHFARECTSKGTNDGKKRDSFYQDQGAGKKEQNQNCLLTMDDGEQEAKILAYTLAVKKLEAQVVTFQKQQLSLNEQLTFQANEIYAKDEKLKKYRRIGMKAVKEKEQLQKISRGCMIIHSDMAGTEKSSTNSKAEEFLTELQNLKTQEKAAYSTCISEDTPEILALRRELDELAPKHLREVPKNKATSTTSVNSGSGSVNSQHASQDDSDMPELTIFNKPQKGIFDEASYDDEGMVHDFNNLPTEVAVSPIPTLRIHNIHPQILDYGFNFMNTKIHIDNESTICIVKNPVILGLHEGLEHGLK
ncbi:ribonuclease H-like domain-containing protein [Tanacetum coccineum]